MEHAFQVLVSQETRTVTSKMGGLQASRNVDPKILIYNKDNEDILSTKHWIILFEVSNTNQTNMKQTSFTLRA